MVAEPKLEEGIPCMLCELLVQILQKSLVNSTEKEFEQRLLNFCNAAVSFKEEVCFSFTWCGG